MYLSSNDTWRGWKFYAESLLLPPIQPTVCECGHKKHSSKPGIGCITKGCLCLSPKGFQ